jgi:dihydrofolate synthase/folylpolyglutamate synthase
VNDVPIREAARSDDPALDALLKRALELHPAVMDLGLERMRRLLSDLGDPQDALPPVFHVAGTNGKGSTCAFLRACLEAAGKRVHVYTSPHMVRFNERIRLSGQLIRDDELGRVIEEVMARNQGQSVTFFELTTAAALLAFAGTEADAAIIEVGMGGRLDATNVFEAPAMTGIAQLGLDHQKWLGRSILQIAGEKAGIARPGAPMVHAKYPRTVAARVAEVAGTAGARLHPRGVDWDAADYRGQLHYRDAMGVLHLPPPRLAGPHQLDNAALAVAMLRHQSAIDVPEAAYRAGLGWADWPGRLQRLDATPLGRRLPEGSELWLDGAHNPAGARALAQAFAGHSLSVRPLHLIAGMLEAKDAGQWIAAFTGRLSAFHPVPIEGHRAHPPELLAMLARAQGLKARPAASVGAALDAIAADFAHDPRPPVVIIAGSLYLAGAVLAEAGVLPG